MFRFPYQPPSTRVLVCFPPLPSSIVPAGRFFYRTLVTRFVRGSGSFRVEPQGSLQFPGNPSCVLVVLSPDPGRPSVSSPDSYLPFGHRSSAPLPLNAEAPTIKSHFEALSHILNTAPPTLHAGLSPDDARLACGWWLTFTARVLHPLDSCKEFQFLLT